MCDLPELGIVGPARLQDRLLVIAIIALSSIYTLFLIKVSTCITDIKLLAAELARNATTDL